LSVIEDVYVGYIDLDINITIQFLMYK